MTNVVDICNLALSHLGEESSVVSIDPPEGSAQAEKLAVYYKMALRFLLSVRNWGFATKSGALVLRETNDREKWQYCYAMPADCLRIIRVDSGLSGRLQPDVAGRRENYETGLNAGNVMCVYTNVPEATVAYVTDQSNPSDFSPAFSIALSWKLAAMLSGTLLTGSEGANMANNCENMMQQYLQEAARQDAQQNRQNLGDTIPQFILHRG